MSFGDQFFRKTAWLRRKAVIKQRPPPEFVDWCKQPAKTRESTHNLQKYFAEARKRVTSQDSSWAPKALVQFLRNVNAALEKGGPDEILLSDPSSGALSEVSEDFELKRQTRDLSSYVTTLNCSGGVPKTLKLTNISIKLCGIQVDRDVELNHCAVGRLLLYNCRSITLNDCHIGTLWFSPNAARIGDFAMRGGCILNIDCPPSWASSPYVGSFSLLGVFLPKNSKQYLITNPQPYRNLRAHLRKLDNSQAANIIHSAELAMERETDTLFYRVVSHHYERISDFGSSALRPLIWLLIYFILSAALFYFYDAVSLSLAENEYKGWRENLIGDTNSVRFWKAITLSFQNIGNPLSILGAKTLVVAKNGWFVAWSTIQSVLSLTFIALFFLAVRRRFKMQ